MQLEEITLAMFAACNAVRLVAYVPQIRKAAKDLNGASSVSCTTWSLFLLANLSTVAYALVNRSDWGLAACFASNAVCCIAILVVVNWKRRNYLQATHKAVDGRGRCSCFFGKSTLNRLKRRAPVRGDLATIESTHNLAPRKAFKEHLLRATVCSHRLGLSDQQK
jgi:hypothetical protein